MNTTDSKNAFGHDNKQSGASHNSESAAPQKSKRNDAAYVVEFELQKLDKAFYLFGRFHPEQHDKRNYDRKDRYDEYRAQR